MKKVFKALIALCCTLCIAMGMISCKEVKGKSKIERITVTIDVNGTSHDFNFELYLNYAEGTIEHFKELVAKNYYDNTAISNVSGHVEFGAYYFEGGVFKSKYDKDYSAIISESYMSGKYLYYGKDKNEMKDYPRYRSGRLVGEFAYNGYTGNELDLNGALVLKRDVDTDAPANAYDTARATMAVTFGSDYYFTSPSEFAIIGKICTDDTENGDSSYTRLRNIMTEYEEDSKGNIYYYYTLGSDFGNYFMYDAEEGCYFAKDADGLYNVKIEDDAEVEEDAEELLLKELSDNSVYLNTIPYAGVTIKIVDIKLAD
ncbi:MAG: hypothetical protein IKA61_07705 [Clostridia bacterium]|nr:hypothetical protein [Clostridia bacterium]